ncbi:MAG: amidohydrolase [Verrucomicrobiota bacterium]
MNKRDEAESLIHKSVEQQARTLRNLALKIHARPELGYEEIRACAWQTALLKRWKFNVDTPYVGIDTSYRAAKGQGKPSFCILSEYDALPDLGHGCGHNLIAAASLGAAYALGRVMEKQNLKGTLTVLGTPAEESGGGKVRMVKAGAFKAFDAIIMPHPDSRTRPDTGCTAIQRFRVSFSGQSAHAASSPEMGRNALDALMLVFQGVNAWRQQLEESSRIHGVVKEGGTIPNIIPDAASGIFYLRSPRDSVLRTMVARFRNIVKGAALMTGTKPAIEDHLVPYKARWPNATLNRLYMEAADACGLDPEMPEHPKRGSSDFGDVSHKAPGAHVYFGISKKNIAGHSPQFREASQSDYALDQMLKASESLARVGYAFMTESSVRREARENFHKQRRKLA